MYLSFHLSPRTMILRVEMLGSARSEIICFQVIVTREKIVGIGETGTLHDFLHHQISFTRTTGSRCPDQFPATGLARIPDIPRWAAGIAEEDLHREATPRIIMPKDGRARRVPMTPSLAWRSMAMHKNVSRLANFCFVVISPKM